MVRGGEDDQGRSYGWVFIVALAGLAAVASMLNQHGKPSAEPTRPVPILNPIPAASPTSSPHPSGTLVSDLPGPGALDPTQAALARQTGWVQAHDICPIVTDHRASIAITFILENITPVHLTIAKVMPVLPLKGLRPTGVELHYGLCNDRVGSPGLPQPQLGAGGTVLVTLNFALPDSCPAPYPVLLRVIMTIDGQRRVEDLPLLSDLGGVRFDSCKTVTTPAD
ncbi:MAG: hypothetical protein QOF82_404 [Frankiales bacterium]|nr:hypothetical protein [Frankiales bacterium]